jgi:Winged helix DNA-binding domain
VQAQDYPGAKWALGLRAPGLTDEDVERAFTRGDILRTHVLRPTWHFVTPGDIRWLLALSGPRINVNNGPYYRRLGLDDVVLKRARRVIDRALAKGGHLTRAAIGTALRRAGIPAEGVALAHVMMNAELEGVVCSGARAGSQFTYALLDDRAPGGRTLTRDEALGKLALRYFGSHGPATVRDFRWWSGLRAEDARRGIEIAGAGLAEDTIGRRPCWTSASGSTTAGTRPTSEAHLLPNYDEYVIAYRDREPDSDVFAHSLIVDGRFAGNWTKTTGRDGVTLDVVSDRRLTPAARRAVAAAADRYARFLKQTVVVTFPTRASDSE